MAEKPQKKPVRLLVDQDINGKSYKCNQAVILDPAHADGLVKNGMADDAKPAVEYAIKQTGEAIDIAGDSAVDPQPEENPPD